MSTWPWSRPAPVAPRPGERILWQAAPRTRGLAIHLYHVRPIALYGAVLTLADVIQARLQHLPLLAALQAAIPGALATGAALLVFLLLAAGSARTTRYTLTDQRLVLQFGLALAATLSLPLRRIEGLSLRLRGDGAGDIALRPAPGSTLAWAKLWPMVRPWRFARAEPMLRDVPDAAAIATVLTRLLAEVNAPAAPAPAHVIDPAAAPAPGSESVPAPWPLPAEAAAPALVL